MSFESVSVRGFSLLPPPENHFNVEADVSAE